MEVSICGDCKNDCESDICLGDEWFEDMDKTAVIFPILNNLTPTLNSCTLKVLEEVGELMQLLGKGAGASGEKVDINKSKWAVNTVCEAIDTAQSAITLAFTLCQLYGFNMDELMEIHENKLREKGYMK